MQSLIIEDDAIQAELLKDVLTELDYIEVIGVCEDIKSAQNLMLKTHVDLIFLDVVLPDVSGIQFLKLIENHHAQVILMSGDSSYAVDGFDYEVTDFISKPFATERIYKAGLRALKRFNENGQQASEFLFVREGQRHRRVAFSDIYYVASAQNYVEIHTKERKFMELSTLKDFEKKLPAKDFIRCHRQYVANVSKVSQIGTLGLHLENDAEIPLGAKYREDVFKRLGLK